MTQPLNDPPIFLQAQRVSPYSPLPPDQNFSLVQKCTHPIFAKNTQKKSPLHQKVVTVLPSPREKRNETPDKNTSQFLHRKLGLYKGLENILINEKTLIPTVIDYNFLYNLKTNAQASTACGSPYSFPPEMFEGKGQTEKGDAWSFGMLLYFICFQHVPLCFSPFFNSKQFGNNVVKFVSSNKLASTTNSKDPNIQNSPFFKDKNLWDLLDHLLCAESKRWTVKQALKHRFFRNRDSLN